MRVLVTGGAGFIGTNVCRLLLETDRVTGVRVLDDLSTGFLHNVDSMDVEFHEATLLDTDAVGRAVDDCDAVVHLAALGSVPRSVANPLASHEANATGTLNVLIAARDGGNLPVVVASSSSVYGSVPDLPKHEDLPTRPMSPYAASKLATEWYTLAFRECYGLPALAFRFFNVYGPHQPAHHAYAPVMPAFIEAALAGEPIPVHGDGSQSRDFTYVGTVAEVIVDAIVRRASHATPVNLAFGSRIDLLEIINHLEEILGRPLERAHTANRPGDVPHTQADPTLLLSLFPDIVPVEFRPGIEATVDWWKSLR
jgi:UDP-glucose 4-epimerase